MYKPVTTPCQHTFCADCLQRSIDHSTICPLCRQALPGYAYFQLHPCNKVISKIVETVFPTTHHERAEAVTADVDSRLETPIFVCTLSLPGLPTLLQIFEPKYRLMLRRCLEAAEPRFGMIVSETSEYGTMLEVRSVQMLPDGRSMVETWGASRFRVVEKGTRDGYMVGRVEYFEDMSPGEELAALPPNAPTSSDLMLACHKFLEELRGGAKPWVLQRMENMASYMPEDDPAMFSFWMALILPLHDKEKVKLLPIRSAQMRLQVIVRWIGQFHDSWYAQWLSHGCVIC
ncbi:PUA-like domain-containing protein [Pterulicium gracile]|uniref:PUA-like domain-containing protein n=1 Tax=Pterulicium gracile TaxID=1884261 RepID=A0A5C3QVI7_9AGAR|nr:PUA-like domain-containing protein [Pterula gracilis]